MSDIYASVKHWEGKAVEHPDAVRRLAEKSYGLAKEGRLTISLLDDMLEDAERAGNTTRIKQINLAKTFVRQARKHKKHHKHKATAVTEVLSSFGITHIVVSSQDGLDDHLARTDKFETGKPVEILYIHNEEKSPNFGSRYGQDIEPAGFYMIERSSATSKVPEGWTSGAVFMENPLVLDWGSGSYQASDSWKQVLHRVFGLTGRKLTAKLRSLGYTHIVTIDRDDSSEIVDLRGRPNG